MAKITKEDLFDVNADVNSRGYKKNLNTDGEPDQTLMENWNDSIVWKTDTEDRAKQKTGVGTENDEDFVGHVQVAKDTEAKANTSGLEADTTKVVHAGQLPTVDATETQTVGVLTDNLIEVTKDGTTTRNNFLVKLKETFRAWLNTLRGDVDTNTTNISTNATNIATNVSDISTNATNISTNTTNIATNTSDITTIQGDITTIEGDITAIEGDITTLQGITGSTVSSITPSTSNISFWASQSTNESNSSITGVSGTMRFQKIGNIGIFSFSVEVNITHTGIVGPSTHPILYLKVLLPETKSSGTYPCAVTLPNSPFTDRNSGDAYSTDGVIDGLDFSDYLAINAPIDIRTSNGVNSRIFRGQLIYQTA